MPKTVLVVEDDAMNMKLFHDILESQGLVCLPAIDGQTALALVRQQHADLILMDVQLPDISGLDLTRTIKNDSALRHIPIIAVTASAMRGDEERVMASGCDAYVSKPFPMMDLVGLIRAMLGDRKFAHA